MEQFTSTIGIYVAEGLVVIAAALAIILPIIFSIIQGKFSIKAIIGMVALVAIIGIIYVISPGEISQVFQTSKYSFVDEGLMKYAETCITSSIVLLFIALASWVVLELVNFVKNLT